MKARRVKDLDPAGELADNAERIVLTRLDELCSFMPRAADPERIEALHDMRIAAKRLRYVLEIAGPCFGPYARGKAVDLVKDLQDLLGEIHDCDVQLPAVAAFADELLDADAVAIGSRAAGAEDLDPKLLARAPHRGDHAGLAALRVHLRARRELLFARFLEAWEAAERKGFRARLEYAVSERSQPRPPAGATVEGS